MRGPKNLGLRDWGAAGEHRDQRNVGRNHDAWARHEWVFRVTERRQLGRFQALGRRARDLQGYDGHSGRDHRQDPHEPAWDLVLFRGSSYPSRWRSNLSEPHSTS